jgi:hypothetical protein
MSRRVAALAGALLVLALAACDGGSPAPADPRSTPASSAPDVTEPPAADFLVEYGRQGGIAGVDDRLTVLPDGAYEISRNSVQPRRGTLPPAELAALRATLERTNFADIPAVNSGGGIVDGFTHYVVYGDHAVLAEDGAIPAALRPVISALDRVIQNHG